MDEAFVENAEHEIDDEHGHDEQQAEALERGLERRGVALEAGADARRAACPRAASSMLLHGVAERDAGLRVEGDRDGRAAGRGA